MGGYCIDIYELHKKSELFIRENHSCYLTCDRFAHNFNER